MDTRDTISRTKEGPDTGPVSPAGPATTASAEPPGVGAGAGDGDGAALTDSVPASAATAVSGRDSAARCSAGGPRSAAATCGRRSSPSWPRSRCTATRSSPSSPSAAGACGDPSPGSVYPTLQAMEDQGLVTADKSEGRRVFSLTDEGRAAAEAAGDGPAPWEEAARSADRSLVDLRGLMGEVGAAIMQVGPGRLRPADQSGGRDPRPTPGAGSTWSWPRAARPIRDEPERPPGPAA